LAPSGGHCHFCYRQFAWASHTPCWKKVRVERARDKRRKRAVSSVTCAQAVALLADYISGELKAADRLALESHQQICADCVAFMQTYRKTIELSRSFLRLRGAAQSGSLSLRR
jgi:hypothetical protein